MSGRGGLFALAAAVLVAVSLELLANAVLRTSDRVFDFYASYAQLRARYGPPMTLPHPEIGYVTGPGFERGANRHNRAGFRGNEIRDVSPRTWRVATLGGSTTYSGGVDDHRDAYPHLLEQTLQAHFPECDVQVINGGVPGYTTHHSLLNWRHRVSKFAPQLVIVYHGVNDLSARLVWPAPNHHADYRGVFVSYRNPAIYAYWENLAVLRIPAIRLGLITSHNSAERLYEFGSSFVRLELHQQLVEGRYPDGLFRTVPLARMLRENDGSHFLSNIEALVVDVQRTGSEVLLVSFAAAPRPGTVLALPELREALNVQNRHLRRLADALNVDLLDLASTLSGDDSLFVDGVHFNAAGNARRADLISQALHARAPDCGQSALNAEPASADRGQRNTRQSSGNPEGVATSPGRRIAHRIRSRYANTPPASSGSANIRKLAVTERPPAIR